MENDFTSTTQVYQIFARLSFLFSVALGGTGFIMKKSTGSGMYGNTVYLLDLSKAQKSNKSVGLGP
jgi:hypothetical protein